MDTIQPLLRIVPYHDEAKTLWYVVDAAAPEDEQPCVLATCQSPDEAQSFLRCFVEGRVP